MLARRPLLLLVPAIVAAAGCLEADAPSAGDEAGADAPTAGGQREAQRLEWKGHVVFGVLDAFAHDQPTEEPIFGVQQAGFNVHLEEMPEAIEVRVDWTAPPGAPAGFRMHPHFLVGDDASGTTRYYGYFSPMYTTAPGCIRIPAADMAAGLWPMMIHPNPNTVQADFTLTVGVVGATPMLMKDLHGHRADGNYVIEDHAEEECQFLV